MNEQQFVDCLISQGFQKEDQVFTLSKDLLGVRVTLRISIFIVEGRSYYYVGWGGPESYFYKVAPLPPNEGQCLELIESLTNFKFRDNHPSISSDFDRGFQMGQIMAGVNDIDFLMGVQTALNRRLELI